MSDTQTQTAPLLAAPPLPAPMPPRPVTDQGRRLDALDRAAIILMTLDQNHAQQIFAKLEDEEIRRVSRTMANLGRTDAALVERTVSEFQAALGRAGNLVGSMQNTERMLRHVLPAPKVAEIMQDISGGTGKVWEKLTQVPADALAAYLGNESPQTAAVILAKLPSQHAARVLPLLPNMGEVALRIVRTERVQNTVMSDIEETLRREFVGDGAGSRGRDSSATLAELLNHADKAMVQQLLATMSEQDADAAVRVRRLMFGFEDLIRIDPATFGALVAECPAEKLPIALAAAEARLRDLFLLSMSERAGNMLREEIESMPAPRKRVVDEAQAEIVALAKRLAEEGRIFILNADDDGDRAQPG
jgi:flagellar motor switch protein FliG